MTFKLRILHTVRFYLADKPWKFFTLERLVSLPFTPAPGLFIRFDSCDMKCDRLEWIVSEEIFIAQSEEERIPVDGLLKAYGSAKAVLAYLFGDGWDIKEGSPEFPKVDRSSPLNGSFPVPGWEDSKPTGKAAHTTRRRFKSCY